MFEPLVSFALANALASRSFRKVSVFLMIARWPDSRSFGSNETYQVPLDLFGRGSRFISPSPSARSEPRDGRLSFVLCQGDVTANKWIVVSAEERSLFRGRSSRPSKGRQVSFAPQWSTVCASALRSSSGFRVQPEIEQAATLYRNPLQ